MESLLKDLEDKIDDADKRMNAHPIFLDELRALVDRYRAELREVFLYDDFADRDYTRNPKWVVKAGQFKITPARRLWNRVDVERSSPTSSSSGEDVLGIQVRSHDVNGRRRRPDPGHVTAGLIGGTEFRFERGQEGRQKHRQVESDHDSQAQHR